jgi:hypothetical protein
MCDNVYGCSTPSRWEFVYDDDCQCLPSRMTFCTPCKDTLVRAYADVGRHITVECYECGLDVGLPPVIAELEI